MPEFDIVFEKLVEELALDVQMATDADASRNEIDEIEELRRYASEIQDPPPAFLTTT